MALVSMSIMIDIQMARSLLPVRPADGHKGTFGHVFVAGGARGYTGAVKMAALAAARSGAGLVTAGIPETLADVIAASLLEVMTLPLPATDTAGLSDAGVAAALEFAAGRDAVVLGPGIGQHPQTQRFVLEFAAACPAPLVIDADGLNALCGDLGVLRRVQAPVILTPHPGEMARLTGRTVRDVQSGRERIAAAFAVQYGCIVVLKGHGTVVAAPEASLHINTTGNAGMATGGTGDVLSGLTGGLLAQKMAPLDAALLGVYTHGLAGDLAAAEKTQRGMIASDLIDMLPAAWHKLESRQ